MKSGHILSELRAWRDEFARSHGYDLGAMGAALREMDAAAGARVVRSAPRRPIAMTPEGPSPPIKPLRPTSHANEGLLPSVSPPREPAAER